MRPCAVMGELMMCWLSSSDDGVFVSKQRSGALLSKWPDQCLMRPAGNPEVGVHTQCTPSARLAPSVSGQHAALSQCAQ